MKTESWLWPDRVIGKRESRRLREEHNALVNRVDNLARALSELVGIQKAADEILNTIAANGFNHVSVTWIYDKLKSALAQS